MGISYKGHNVITTVRGVQPQYKNMFTALSVNKVVRADIEASLLEWRKLEEDAYHFPRGN